MTRVRLAICGEFWIKKLEDALTVVRLAQNNDVIGERGLARKAPDIRLAHVPGAQGDNVLEGRNGVEKLGEHQAPALLVSFYYLAPFEKARARYVFRDWVLDSGAFSAHNSGATIDLVEYTEKAKELLATDPKLTEVFSLDVIGDWRASLANTEAMWKAGVPAIPCFHVGEPEDVLKALARDYPKIALGGAVGYRGKSAWAAQCFARVWPKRIHGFGFGGERDIMALPFHSVDATNWEIAPCKFGQWKAYGGNRVSVRGSAQNLRAEVEWYLKLEERARERWKREMAELESDELKSPTVRLVGNGNAGRENVKAAALAGPEGPK